MSIDLSKMPKFGFGLMRLPEQKGIIDFDQVCKMADAYLAAGFNYFDTAYTYHSGNSEKVVKEALVKRHKRESFTLATKLPLWEIKQEGDVERIFNEQLERTGAEYFDFYLLHSIEEGSHYDTCEKYNLFSWATQKKKEGLVKHIGFSFHGSPELLEQVLDQHKEVEFVQIQLNYADWDNPIVQSGKLYKILKTREIPIIVMEPIKGGILANPVPEIAEMFKKEAPFDTPASLALRFVGSLPGIATILSGMSTYEQVLQNIDVFREFRYLSGKEKEAIEKAVAITRRVKLIECTGCRYCCEGCPMQIPIPDVFRAVNTMKIYNETFRPRAFYSGITENTGKACECTKCGQCESVCPQHLNIIELMEEASGMLDVPLK